MNLNITRARFIGGVLAQAGNAALAFCTAASISAMVESGRSAICSPVAGLNTGLFRADDEVDALAADGVLDDLHHSTLLMILVEHLDDPVDVLLLDDQRRRHRDDVAGGADQEPSLEGLDEGRERPLGRRARDRLELDRADEPDVADVDDARQALQRVERILPVLA